MKAGLLVDKSVRMLGENLDVTLVGARVVLLVDSTDVYKVEMMVEPTAQ